MAGTAVLAGDYMLHEIHTILILNVAHTHITHVAYTCKL